VDDAGAARPVGTSAEREVIPREVLHAATLAASSHNTQPWRLHVAGNVLEVRPDFSRRTPVVDPDDHHVYVSLGCAAENAVIAATAFGLAGRVEFAPAPDGGVVRVVFEKDAAPASPLVEALPHRQCSRAPYDGQPVTPAELRRLAGAENEDLRLVSEPSQLATIADYVAQGNAAQLRDPAFVRELIHWMRFTPGEARRHGDGLLAPALGIPPLPRLLATPLLRFAMKPASQSARDIAALRSSAGVALFLSERDEPSCWVETGRRYERFAIEATCLGIRNAFMNQPVEVPALRTGLATALGLNGPRLSLLVRFGYGPTRPRSYRRPLDSVLS
jgi:hypothetical protein